MGREKNGVSRTSWGKKGGKGGKGLDGGTLGKVRKKDDSRQTDLIETQTPLRVRRNAVQGDKEKKETKENGSLTGGGGNRQKGL